MVPLPFVLAAGKNDLSPFSKAVDAFGPHDLHAEVVGRDQLFSRQVRSSSLKRGSSTSTTAKSLIFAANLLRNGRNASVHSKW